MAHDLVAKLREETQEIRKLVAIAYGWGDVASLGASKLQQLNSDVEEIIDQHEEALLEGETPQEWHALDERLARTEIGRLLQERHEIEEQIFEAEEDEDDADGED